MSYPKAIKFKNIKKEKRICALCGNRIISRGNFYVKAIECGKYLCFACEHKEDKN